MLNIFFVIEFNLIHNKYDVKFVKILKKDLQIRYWLTLMKKYEKYDEIFSKEEKLQGNKKNRRDIIMRWINI